MVWLNIDEPDQATAGLWFNVFKAVSAIPTPTLARMLAFRDRPECAAEVAFAVAALRARGIEVNEPERGEIELDEAQEEDPDLNGSDDFEVEPR